MTLKLEVLVGMLLTYEVHLHEEKKESSHKGVTLKVTTKGPESRDNSNNEELEDEIVILAKGFHKIPQKKKFDFKNLCKGQPQKETKYKIPIFERVLHSGDIL